MTMPTIPDISMDSIEALAGFDIPPPGRYLCLLSLLAKDINGKGNLVLSYVVQETIELADPTSVEPKQGTKFDELFSFEKGLPIAKEKLDKLVLGLELPANAKLSDLIEAVQQVGVEVTLTHRADKLNPDRKYPSVKAATFKLA